MANAEGSPKSVRPESSSVPVACVSLKSVRAESSSVLFASGLAPLVWQPCPWRHLGPAASPRGVISGWPPRSVTSSNQALLRVGRNAASVLHHCTTALLHCTAPPHHCTTATKPCYVSGATHPQPSPATATCPVPLRLAHERPHRVARYAWPPPAWSRYCTRGQPAGGRTDRPPSTRGSALEVLAEGTSLRRKTRSKSTSSESSTKSKAK